ncbi:hypothetical protein KR074_010711 [Drosophila pseudoananassae]|nr:hypothetical protein KR074_010711 [Drosophila pseudoananassae]
MISFLRSLLSFSWRTSEMENRRRSGDNIEPSDIIDLTGDDEDADFENRLPHWAAFQNYKCPICLLHPSVPVSTICGHVFCDECLMMSLDSGDTSCPICKTFIDAETIIRLYI